MNYPQWLTSLLLDFANRTHQEESAAVALTEAAQAIQTRFEQALKPSDLREAQAADSYENGFDHGYDTSRAEARKRWMDTEPP